MTIRRFGLRLPLSPVAVLTVSTVSGHGQHPLGKELLDWRPDQKVARALAMNFDFHGGNLFVIWRKPGRIEERDGRTCLAGPYFFFDVDDEYPFNMDETLTVELLFDRRETDGFNISYDHAVAPRYKQIRFTQEDPALIREAEAELP